MERFVGWLDIFGESGRGRHIGKDQDGMAENLASQKLGVPFGFC